MLSQRGNWGWSSRVPLPNLEPMNEAVRTVAIAMLTTPVRHPLGATVREIREFFDDDHVQAALIVGPAGYLAAVVERGDITHCQPPDAAAAPLGRLAGRTVLEDASLAEIQRAMSAAGRRRAAVISEDGRLLGLLCLKASRSGFCSEEDVHARALDAARNAVLAGTDSH
jgi:CBS domain-containing protein